MLKIIPLKPMVLIHRRNISIPQHYETLIFEINDLKI